MDDNYCSFTLPTTYLSNDTNNLAICTEILVLIGAVKSDPIFGVTWQGWLKFWVRLKDAKVRKWVKTGRSDLN